MTNEQGKYGRKWKIPKLLECWETRNYTIKLNDKPIQGRPVFVMEQLLDLGYQHHFFNSDFLSKIVHYGFDKNYWSDWALLKADMEYFLKDMSLTKEKRLKGETNADK